MKKNSNDKMRSRRIRRMKKTFGEEREGIKNEGGRGEEEGWRRQEDLQEDEMEGRDNKIETGCINREKTDEQTAMPHTLTEDSVQKLAVSYVFYFCE